MTIDYDKPKNDYVTSTTSYELAGTGRRFIALIIDSIVFSIVGGIIGLNLDLIGGGFISIILGAGYQWYFLTQHNGQTIGKMLLNIRVIKVDGSKINDADAIMRYIGYLINSPIILLGWLWAFWDDNRQGWHDKIARTYVVKA